MPTIAEIIEIAQVSQYLSANAIRKAPLYSNSIDRKLPRLLYMVRKTVERRYDQDPDDTTLPATSNYLYALCGRFSLEAQYLLGIGGGGSVSPIVPATTDNDIYPIYVKENELTDDGEYNNPSIVGDNLIIFFNSNNQNFLVAGNGFEYTPTGIKITMAYDETYTWAIWKLGSGTSTTTQVPTVTNYNLIENDTLIANIAATAEGQEIVIAIKPNGFTYIWDTIFSFNDNWPEQPGAIGENTLQLYEFTYIAAINKLVCSWQAINTPY